MTVKSRTELKTYFISGASPSESDFSDLIDSTLIAEDIVSTFTSSSTQLPLSASAGKILNDLITDIDTRVTTLEGAESDFASGYYTKTEVDTKIDGVSSLIDALPYASQITGIKLDIVALENELDGKANAYHTQDMSTINGLTDALMLKASTSQLELVQNDLINTINNLPPVIDPTDDIQALQSSLDTLSNSIDGLATGTELDNKADRVHYHYLADMEDAGNYYTKTEVDSLIAPSNIVGEHTHVVADITDFGTEIQDKTALILSDHTGLTNNPHNVTKEQVGLGNVSNLSPEDMISAAGVAKTTELQVVISDLAAHEDLTDNPHAVTKEQVGLSNVPNVDVQQLLNDHLSAENPHNIDINFYDIYTTAQTDSRIQTQIDAKLGYQFTPLTNDESAGEIADIAYDSGNIYLKTGSSTWLKSPLYPVWTDRKAKQADVDTGLATEVGEIITVNEPPKSGGSPEIFGFIKEDNGDLIVVTTDGGTDDIDSETYSKFREEIWGNTGFSFQIINGDLISTI